MVEDTNSSSSSTKTTSFQVNMSPSGISTSLHNTSVVEKSNTDMAASSSSSTSRSRSSPSPSPSSESTPAFDSVILPVSSSPSNGSPSESSNSDSDSDVFQDDWLPLDDDDENSSESDNSCDEDFQMTKPLAMKAATSQKTRSSCSILYNGLGEGEDESSSESSCFSFEESDLEEGLPQSLVESLKRKKKKKHKKPRKDYLIGEQYQADVPEQPLGYLEKAHDYTDTLQWMPGIVPDDQLQSFFDTLNELFGYPLNEEKVLSFIHKNEYNLEKSLEQAKVIADSFKELKCGYVPPKSLAAELLHNCWTEPEKDLFETGLQMWGNTPPNYVQIQKLIRTKSLEEVIAYYYPWKATRRDIWEIKAYTDFEALSAPKPRYRLAKHIHLSPCFVYAGIDHEGKGNIDHLFSIKQKVESRKRKKKKKQQEKQHKHKKAKKESTQMQSQTQTQLQTQPLARRRGRPPKNRQLQQHVPVLTQETLPTSSQPTISTLSTPFPSQDQETNKDIEEEMVDVEYLSHDDTSPLSFDEVASFLPQCFVYVGDSLYRSDVFNGNVEMDSNVT
eukprot:TRINITY_DN682_c0_g2_i1.p1 TRINITY_DN682_c0_g2~~TRINITY_DN682_c0_g2_i1.p1  ORF type:complete len:559 (+),score=112.51 TRINITY_DN682_c0_g2_i1:375-2051(+)